MSDTTLRDLVLKRLDAETQPEDEWSALVLAGFAPEDALFESASAMGTVGLSSGITNADLPTWVKLMLSLEMWAGRLEVLPVLVLLYPGTWKLRRRSR